MRRISSDQQHKFAHQNSLFQRHGTRRQCESYDFCTDCCPDHSKISIAEVRHWIGKQKWEFDEREKKVAQGDIPRYYNTDIGL